MLFFLVVASAGAEGEWIRLCEDYYSPTQKEGRWEAQLECERLYGEVSKAYRDAGIPGSGRVAAEVEEEYTGEHPGLASWESSK